MGSHSRFNTEFRGAASTASVPMETPQWHIKMALFVCEVAAFSTSWGHFCIERARKRSNLPNERDTRCKTKKLCDGSAVPPSPFRPAFSNRSFSLFPPSSLSCEFIYLKNGEKFYKRKTNVEEKYCAVAESESFIGAPTTLCQLPELPLCAAHSLTSCWRTVLPSTHTSYAIEDDLNRD